MNFFWWFGFSLVLGSTDLVEDYYYDTDSNEQDQLDAVNGSWNVNATSNCLVYIPVPVPIQVSIPVPHPVYYPAPDLAFFRNLLKENGIDVRTNPFLSELLLQPKSTPTLLDSKVIHSILPYQDRIKVFPPIAN